MTVTLADLADYLAITAADSRYAQVQDVLDATLEHVASIVGPAGASTVTVRPTGYKLILPATNLATVGTVTDPLGAVVTPTDTDLASGVVTIATVVTPGAYTVTVTRGDSASVDEAVRIIAKHLWETRRGRAGRDAAFAQGDEQVPMGFAIPRRAAELLAPVTVPGFA